jgi:NAD(P) transhydrogenase subunit alpha
MLIGDPAETTARADRVAVTPETAKKSLLIGVPKETAAGEKRVATVPEVVEKLI